MCLTRNTYIGRVCSLLIEDDIVRKIEKGEGRRTRENERWRIEDVICPNVIRGV